MKNSLVSLFMTLHSGIGFTVIFNQKLTSEKLYTGSSLFFIVIITLFLFSFTWFLMSLTGKVEIRLTREGGQIFVGIGFLGVKKAFLWQDMSANNKKKPLRFYLIFLKTEREYYLKRVFNYAQKRVMFNEDF